jgi:chemotaxis family two-component system sensor kinase Cph1
MAQLAAPAFGQADLSNCEREQIHLAGSIQPHGALLVAREPDLTIMQASANAGAFLGLRQGHVIGRRLEELGGNLAARVRPHLTSPLDALPVAIPCRANHPSSYFDALLHRTAADGLVIELERGGDDPDPKEDLGSGLQTILACSSLRQLADEAARLFRALAGYDRVMVYRFDEDGHGEVFSEQRRPELEPLLGNRYPATDIPQIARRLYIRNRVRMLVDVGYMPVPLEPRESPLSGRELDMSLCTLRSMSPIHLQYLKNMGVAATLVVSLVIGGRLWGLVACHHYVPRLLPFARRAVCELLAEAVATRIAALESFLQSQAELSVRRIEQRMIEAIGRDGDWRGALFDTSQALLQPLGASGVALQFEGQVLTAGDVPGTQELRALGEWLDRQRPAPLFATASLRSEAPQFAALTPVASGVLATTVSEQPGEFLMWFRPERVRTVTWGGDPFKAVVVGNDPADLSPRRSFAKWQQLVEGTADPWTPADLAAARMIGETLTDVVQQFRAVRLLIVQHQTDEVRSQLGGSAQPTLIADAEGRVLLANHAFRVLIGRADDAPARLGDLPGLFADSEGPRRRLGELLTQRRPWRGELAVQGADGRTTPLLVRADPVLSSPGKVLGFVLMFTDVTERKRAEAARQAFQESVLRPPAAALGRRDAADELAYRRLMAIMVENAQLTALEITDSIDPATLPDLLLGVQASVTRMAELLDHLIRHAHGNAATPD